MNIHPLIVHFPIALLSSYTLLEFLGLFSFTKKRNLKTTKILLLVGGVAGFLLALQTGELAADLLNSKSLKNMIERHEFFAEISIKPYAILLVMYLLREISENNRQKKYRVKREKYMTKVLLIIQKIEAWKLFVVLAVVGFILLSITGAIGEGLVYGQDADPLTKIMFDFFQ